MKSMLTKGKYTTIGPSEIWSLYGELSGIFRAGGNTTTPKLTRDNIPRKTDLNIQIDSVTKQEMVHPDKTKGLSFADSVQTLAKKKLEGWVWIIPHGTLLPEDLVFNIKDFDHPLLNVSRPMTLEEMAFRLNQLTELMDPCYVKIDKLGNIKEKFAGALEKVSQQ